MISLLMRQPLLLLKKKHSPEHQNTSPVLVLNKPKIMNTIACILLNSVAFFLAAKFLSGVYLRNFTQAIIVGVAVAILNVTLGLVLKIATIGILSLGIFKLLMDAIMIQAADYFLPDFEVKNFWWALLLALMVSIIEGVMSWVF